MSKTAVVMFESFQSKCHEESSEEDYASESSDDEGSEMDFFALNSLNHKDNEEVFNSPSAHGSAIICPPAPLKNHRCVYDQTTHSWSHQPRRTMKIDFVSYEDENIKIVERSFMEYMTLIQAVVSEEKDSNTRVFFESSMTKNMKTLLSIINKEWKDTYNGFIITVFNKDQEDIGYQGGVSISWGEDRSFRTHDNKVIQTRHCYAIGSKGNGPVPMLTIDESTKKGDRIDIMAIYV